MDPLSSSQPPKLSPTTEHPLASKIKAKAPTAETHSRASSQPNDYFGNADHSSSLSSSQGEQRSVDQDHKDTKSSSAGVAKEEETGTPKLEVNGKDEQEMEEGPADDYRARNRQEDPSSTQQSLPFVQDSSTTPNSKAKPVASSPDPSSVYHFHLPPSPTPSSKSFSSVASIPNSNRHSLQTHFPSSSSSGLPLSGDRTSLRSRTTSTRTSASPADINALLGLGSDDSLSLPLPGQPKAVNSVASTAAHSRRGSQSGMASAPGLGPRAGTGTGLANYHHHKLFRRSSNLSVGLIASPAPSSQQPLEAIARDPTTLDVPGVGTGLGIGSSSRGSSSPSPYRNKAAVSGVGAGAGKFKTDVIGAGAKGTRFPHRRNNDRPSSLINVESGPVSTDNSDNESGDDGEEGEDSNHEDLGLEVGIGKNGRNRKNDTLKPKKGNARAMDNLEGGLTSPQGNLEAAETPKTPFSSSPAAIRGGGGKSKQTIRNKSKPKPKKLKRERRKSIHLALPPHRITTQELLPLIFPELVDAEGKWIGPGALNLSICDEMDDGTGVSEADKAKERGDGDIVITSPVIGSGGGVFAKQQLQLRERERDRDRERQQYEGSERTYDPGGGGFSSGPNSPLWTAEPSYPSLSLPSVADPHHPLIFPTLLLRDLSQQVAQLQGQLEGVKKLARERGAGEGEVERAAVRGGVDKNESEFGGGEVGQPGGLPVKRSRGKGWSWRIDRDKDGDGDEERGESEKSDSEAENDGEGGDGDPEEERGERIEKIKVDSERKSSTDSERDSLDLDLREAMQDDQTLIGRPQSIASPSRSQSQTQINSIQRAQEHSISTTSVDSITAPSFASSSQKKPPSTITNNSPPSSRKSPSLRQVSASSDPVDDPDKAAATTAKHARTPTTTLSSNFGSSVIRIFGGRAASSSQKDKQKLTNERNEDTASIASAETGITDVTSADQTETASLSKREPSSPPRTRITSGFFFPSASSTSTTSRPRKTSSTWAKGITGWDTWSRKERAAMLEKPGTGTTAPGPSSQATKASPGRSLPDFATSEEETAEQAGGSEDHEGTIKSRARSLSGESSYSKIGKGGDPISIMSLPGISSTIPSTERSTSLTTYTTPLASPSYPECANSSDANQAEEVSKSNENDRSRENGVLTPPPISPSIAVASLMAKSISEALPSTGVTTATAQALVPITPIPPQTPRSEDGTAASSSIPAGNTHPSHFVAIALAARDWISGGSNATPDVESSLRVGTSPKIKRLSQSLLNTLVLEEEEPHEEGRDDPQKDDGPGNNPKRNITVVPFRAPGVDESHARVVGTDAKGLTNAKGAGYLSAMAKSFGLSQTNAKKTTTQSLAPGGVEEAKDERKAPNLTLPGLMLPTVGLSSNQLPSGAKGIQNITVGPASQTPTSALPANVELETIVPSDSKPPALTFSTEHVKKQIVNGESEERLVDRYGFVSKPQDYLDLLKAAKNVGQKPSGDEDDEEDSISVASGKGSAHSTRVNEKRTAVQKKQNADLDILCEALGLPVLGSNISRNSSSSDLPYIKDKEVDGDDELTSPQLSKPKDTGVRLLLNNLIDLQDSADKSRYSTWDSFLKRRQARPGGPTAEESKAGTTAAPSTTALGALDLSHEGVFSKWTECLVGVNQMGRDKAGKEDWSTFRNLVRKGIPNKFRRAIWMECAGVYEIKEPGRYDELLAAHERDQESASPQAQDVLRQIDMDCRRTFPKNVFFGGDGRGVAKLRQVLIAYGWHNPDVGYCQSMNQLAATLLLIFPTQEDAFWMLTCLIDRILPSDYYTSTLLVSRADQRSLHDLLQTCVPTVFHHFKVFSIHESQFTFSWFLTLYSDLPFETVLRVWDILLVEGSVVLFRIALAIFKMNEKRILEFVEMGELLEYMHRMPKGLHQADKLIKIACEDMRELVKSSDVNVLREKHVDRIRLEDAGLKPRAFP